MKISVTSEDILEPSHHSEDNPITHAIRRETGQTWVVFGGTTAYLRSQPHRTVALPYEVFQHWQSHQNTGVWQPFEFEIDIELRERALRQSSSRRNADRRARLRRKQPRAGFDRRIRDRRSNDRRHGERRHSAMMDEQPQPAHEAERTH